MMWELVIAAVIVFTIKILEGAYHSSAVDE